jgi:hypothetical protein
MSIFGDVVPGEGPAPTGFNWAAFLFAGLFLLAFRRFGLFLMWLIAGFLLPMLGGPGVFIATVLNLGVAVYCGFNGNQIAWETGQFDTHEELQRAMRHWNIGALVGVSIVLALLIWFISIV